MGRFIATILALGGLLGLSASANAVTMSPGVPFGFDNGSGLTGTITLEQLTTGDPSGGTGALGGVPLPGPGDQTFVFEAQVLTGGLTDLTISVICPTCGPSFPSTTGAGWIPGACGDVTDIGGTALARKFYFDDGGGDLSGTSDLFFVSFLSGEIAGDGTFYFSFTTGPSGTSPETLAQFMVPEPSSLLLLGLGAGGICCLLSRRRVRS